MADYTPTLIYEHEVRNAFSPPLEYSDVSKVDVLTKIEIIEDYIKAVYFDDVMPTRSLGKSPALLLVMSKIIRGNPVLAQKYFDITKLKLGDYEVTYDTNAKGEHVNAYESAKSWDQMAHDMLYERGSGSRNWTTPVLVNG